MSDLIDAITTLDNLNNRDPENDHITADQRAAGWWHT